MQRVEQRLEIIAAESKVNIEVVKELERTKLFAIVEKLALPDTGSEKRPDVATQLLGQFIVPQEDAPP